MKPRTRVGKQLTKNIAVWKAKLQRDKGKFWMSKKERSISTRAMSKKRKTHDVIRIWWTISKLVTRLT